MAEVKYGIENVFPPTIKLEKIEFNSKEDKEVVLPIGKLPFVWLNDIQINNIISFKLSSSGFLPTISITFFDGYGYFDSLRFTNDDGRVKVFIDSKSTLLKPIYLEFKILSFKKLDNESFSLTGSLNVNKMYTKNVESFSRSTSYEAFKKIASLSNLGFSSNIDNTNDAMTWINTGTRGYEFCKDILERSYRSDTSFMWAFVDFYYNLNFIDVESQLNFDLEKQYGINTNDISHMIEDLGGDDNKEEASPIFLTNDRVASGGSNFFESYKIFNNSTSRSIEKGYSNNIKYYDWDEKSFLNFRVQPLTSTDEDKLILRSDDEEFLESNTVHFWEGKFIHNNVHSNFLFTKIQNQINLNELQKMGIEIVLPVANFNLYRFMKIYVLILNQGLKEINPLFNQKLSGEWLVTEIHFIMDGKSLKQKVRLMRRHLGFSQEEGESNNN